MLKNVIQTLGLAPIIAVPQNATWRNTNFTLDRVHLTTLGLSDELADEQAGIVLGGTGSVWTGTGAGLKMNEVSLDVDDSTEYTYGSSSSTSAVRVPAGKGRIIVGIGAIFQSGAVLELRNTTFRVASVTLSAAGITTRAVSPKQQSASAATKAVELERRRLGYQFQQRGQEQEQEKEQEQLEKQQQTQERWGSSRGRWNDSMLDSMFVLEPGGTAYVSNCLFLGSGNSSSTGNISSPVDALTCPPSVMSSESTDITVIRNEGGHLMVSDTVSVSCLIQIQFESSSNPGSNIQMIDLI